MEWKIVFRSVYVFLQVFLLGVLKVNGPYYWAWLKWMKGHTFRTTGAQSRKDILAVPRYWWRACRGIFDAAPLAEGKQSEVIYCQTPSQQSQFSDYLFAVKGIRHKNMMFRDATPSGMGLSSKFLMLCFITSLAFFLMLASPFSNHRSRLGLMILQWTENVKCMMVCQKWGVGRIFFFGGYENDACYTGLLAKSQGIHLMTIPSANPIRNFYQQVVTDTFVFTADFQKVEHEKYKGQWSSQQTESWPFIEFSKLQPYIKGTQLTNRKAIGFLSRGAWLRKKRGVNAQNNNKDFEYEERCMQALHRFLSSHLGYTLIILPHPMECHRPEFKAQAIQYYQDYFNGLAVVFYDKGLKSYQCFDEMDVTVTAVSSANIERLYCGYKAMFAPLGAEMEFFSGSTLDNIVCRSEDQFDAMLMDIRSKEEDEFFSSDDLKPYRFDAIKIQH